MGFRPQMGLCCLELVGVAWSSELWYSLVDDLGGASVAGDLDRLQVIWLHLGSWAPYPMCRALYSEVRAPVWQQRHASALLSPKGEERQALTSGVPSLCGGRCRPSF